MLLLIFNRKNIFSGLLIPVAGYFLWMHNLMNPHEYVPPVGESAMPFFSLLTGYINSPSTLPAILSFILVTINSLIISWLNFGFQFLPERSWLPGLIYFLAISSEPSLQTIHPAHFATLFTLLTIFFIFGTYHREKEVSFTFNASFFLAIATLFYFPVIFLFPLIWISIFVLQKSDNWRLLVIPIWGFLLPWLFVWAGAFLTDNVLFLWNSIRENLASVNNKYLFDIYFLILTGIVVFLTFLGSISLLSTYGAKKVISRKFFVIFFWMLGLVIASALVLRSVGAGIIALLTIPTSYFVSHFFIMGQRTFWRGALFFIYAAAMIASFFMRSSL
jgi:hypothetical protein